MKTSNTLAALILLSMFLLLIFSSLNDSATFDEVAHIGAGYTYLAQKDGRLNPEHPPLIKMISAVPLLFLNLNFDVNQPFWTMPNVNDRQWAAGNSLLYESGNNADKILFWSRLPLMILTLLFGWFIFWWTRKNYGFTPALLSLLFFALSPTFLAHSRYVTTDLGAAFAFFLSVIFFIDFFKANNKKSAIYFGIILGLSLLIKFSLVILLPFFAVVGIVFYFKPSSHEGEKWRLWVKKGLVALLTALSIIYVFYIPLVWNYPLEQNLKDARYTLGNYKTAQFAPKIDFWLLSHELTRPIGQYLHGFLMAAQRTAGGNSAYFWGEVSSNGWTSYFPVLFFTKEQIGLYILILLAFLVNWKKGLKEGLRVKEGIFLFFILYYWAWSLWSPLNIGIRHILPTFPFIYILISKPIIEWVKRDEKAKWAKKIGVSALLFWMTLEILFVFPYFLSYYNEFAGGWRTGYRVATDSNYDWGQDLKRLKIWTKQNNVNKIYIDYFGGGSLKYYFGNKAESWRYEKGPPLAGSYFAISANSLVGAENLYYWLKGKEPIARAGSSIFIFSF